MPKRRFLILILLLASLFTDAQQSLRERMPMDFGWSFAFGHPSETAKDYNNATSYFSYLTKAGYGDGAAASGFDDRAWRKLDLPHDWAVEQDFSSKGSFSHGFKSIGRSFPERSVGWYRKTFVVPASDLGRKISIDFDGVFRNSSVWVNGHYLGTEASGYNGFRYDISDILNYGGQNVVAVRVDATMEEGWFYEGAGIYRHVWLTKTNPLHVAHNGTFVTSTVKKGQATINVKADIINEGKTVVDFSVVQTIVDAQGTTVATKRIDNPELSPFQTRQTSMDLPVPNPHLWDLDSPYLYKVNTVIFSGAVAVDKYETSFGIRTIRFDAREGFFLNGKNIKLKGTNNHQDHAGVGTALPDELQDFRIRALKSFGSNAYRCSHHPPAPELLAACDRLGMLVVDENRLMGTNGQMYKDMRGMITRDRNHPSVIAWSIGNEEWAIENSITGARIASTMQAYAKTLDSSRAITAGISGGFNSGISDVIDVMGYNYLANGDIEAHHKRFPDQPAMGTEEGSTFATRGVYKTDAAKHYAAAYDRKPRPSFYSIEEGWNFYANRPWLAGMFIWTGFDYRGEPTPYGWPSVTSYFGMLDLCGFPKDNFYYLRSWWSAQPTLHLLPHWDWPGEEGKEIDVWAYSNCDEVELFLNNKSLGRQAMRSNGHLEWKVKYAPGTLKAIGYKQGKKILTEVVETSATPASLRMVPHKDSLKADGRDLAVITVSLMDKNGVPVRVAGDEVTFKLTGPGRIIGVGNGDPTSLEKEKFLDEISIVEIKDLQEKRLQSVEEGLLALSASDTANWVTAFKNRDYKNLAAAYAHRGSFELPPFSPDSRITLFYKSIGNLQSVNINGHEITKGMFYVEEGNVFIIPASQLKPGKNQLDIIAIPIGKKHDWDVVNENPGTIQVFTPAATWRRKLFNGLAQVIVQTTTNAGRIILEASAPGMKTSVLKFDSEPRTGQDK